jgi:hypothetical protein
MMKQLFHKKKDAAVNILYFIIISALIMVYPSTALTQKNESTEDITPQATDVIKVGVLYSAEFRGECEPPKFQSTLGSKVMVAFRNAGLNVKLGGSPQLISQENLEYSLMTTQGETDLRTGKIFAEVGPGSELNFKNTEGKAVVLQIDVTKICWDIDLDAIISNAKKKKADHVFLVKFNVQDLTSEINKNGSLGNQKSLSVNVEFYLINTQTSQVVDAYSGEKRTMDVSTEGAVNSSAEYLASQIVKSLENSQKDGNLGW